MTKLRILALLLLFVPALASAASGGALQSSGTDLGDKASLQRGALPNHAWPCAGSMPVTMFSPIFALPTSRCSSTSSGRRSRSSAMRE